MGDQHSLANKVAFAFVAASAGVQAMQQALKDAPDLVRTIGLPDMNVGGWNYVPLLLVTLGVFVWLVERAYRAGFVSVDTSYAKTVGDALQAASLKLDKPRTPPPSNGREFFPDDVTYADLVGRLAGKTDLQKAALTTPYRGKWMRSVGTFHDVTVLMNGEFLVFIRIEGAGNVACAFNAQWGDQIASINVGDLVTFDGKLDSLTRGARFTDCELVEVRASPPKGPKPARRRKAGSPKPSSS